MKLVLLDRVAALLRTELGGGDASAPGHVFSQQQLVLCACFNPLQVAQRDVKLVLLDSVAALLRTELGGGDASALAARGEQLGRQAIALKVLAEQHRIPVVVTNQVRGLQQQQRVGTDVLIGAVVHWLQCGTGGDKLRVKGEMSSCSGCDVSTGLCQATAVKVLAEQHRIPVVVTNQVRAGRSKELQ